MMKKRIFLATVVAALAGCGTNLPKPVDPLLNLGLAPDRGAKRSALQSYQGQPVGVLLSQNTRNLVNWQEKEVAHSSSSFVVNSLAAQSDSDDAALWDNPAVISASAYKMLGKKFKGTVPVPDLAAAGTAGVQLVAVVDIQVTETGCSWTVDECMPIMQAQYTLVFLDAKAHHEVAALRAVGSSGYCDLKRAGDEAFNHARCIQEARVRALDTAREKLDAMLPEVSPAKQATSPAESGDSASQQSGISPP